MSLKYMINWPVTGRHCRKLFYKFCSISSPLAGNLKSKIKSKFHHASSCMHASSVTWSEIGISLVNTWSHTIDTLKSGNSMENFGSRWCSGGGMRKCSIMRILFSVHPWDKVCHMSCWIKEIVLCHNLITYHYKTSSIVLITSCPVTAIHMNKYGN